MTCTHPDGVLLYHASDDEGNEIDVYRCGECGNKYIESAY